MSLKHLEGEESQAIKEARKRGAAPSKDNQIEITFDPGDAERIKLARRNLTNNSKVLQPGIVARAFNRLGDLINRKP